MKKRNPLPSLYRFRTNTQAFTTCSIFCISTILGILLSGLGLASCTPQSPTNVAFQAYSTAAEILDTYNTAAAPTQPQPSALIPTLPPQATPLPSSTPSPTPIAFAAVQDIRIAAVLPESLNPYFMNGNTNMIANILYPGLLQVDANTLQVLSGAAESWQVSDDGLTWTFYLRNDIPWVRYNPDTQRVEFIVDDTGNTRMLSANDFVSGFGKFVTSSELTAYHPLLVTLFNKQTGTNDDAPVRANAVNDQILVVTFNASHTWSDLFFTLPIFATQPTWYSPASEDEIPPSYGPMAIKTWKSTSRLALTANPFWSTETSISPATLQNVEFTNIYLLDPLQAFQNGELNLAWLDSFAYQKAHSNPDLQPYLTNQAGNCLTYLAYNTDAAPFNNAVIRMAFSLAIDRQQVFVDTNIDTTTPTNLLAEWMRNAPNPDLIPDMDLPYQPEHASSLLDTYYTSNIPEITLTFIDDSQTRDIASSIIRQWQNNLNIKGHTRALSQSEFLSFQSAPSTQVWLGQYCPSLPDAIYFLESWQTNPSLNLMNWTDQEYTNLLENAKLETNPDRKEEDLLLAQNYLIQEQAILLPLYWEQQVELSSPSLMHDTQYPLFMEKLENWLVLGQ